MIVNQDRRNVAMKFSKETSISILIILFFAVFFLISCTNLGPTKPNIPFASNPYPAVLNELAQANPLLADELGKLPELQDGFSPPEISALKRIVEIYNNNQKDFDEAFKEMYKLGKPEVRRYCSPLQALFWLAQADMLNISENNIFIQSKMFGIYVYFPFSTNTIIDITWRGKLLHMSEASKSQKWDDFQTVADRLNAPELVDIYINNYITYRGGKRAHGTYQTFKTKVGHCTDAAYFANYMLKRAGYNTFMRSVRWGFDDWNEVHTGSGIVLEDGSYLIVADFGWDNYKNSIGGPYKTLEEVDYRLSRGRTVIHSAWGAFFPPP